MDRRSLILPGLICAVALSLRLGYLAVTWHHPLTSDASQYDQIARQLIGGHGFSDQYPQLRVHATAFRPPLYPLMLAAAYWVLGASPGVARGLNVAIGVIVVGMTFHVVQRHLSRRAAIGAAIAVAVMPNLIANDTFALDEPLALLLLLVLVDLALRRRWVWTGVIAGALVLTRPSAQYLALVMACWIIFKVGWKRAGQFILVVALTVSPWIARNWVQVGTPTIATSDGYNWAAIYSPPAQQRGGFIDPIYDPYFTSHRLLQFDEAKWDSYLASVGIDGLERHPTYLLHVVVDNFQSFFELRPSMNTGAEVDDGRSLKLVTASLWIFYVELGAGIVGLVLRWRNEAVQLFTIQAVYFTLASLLFISAPRLRAPVDLALAIGVGCFVDVLLQPLRPGPTTSVVPADRASTPCPPDCGGARL